MLSSLASLVFYARFLPSFSRIGYLRRARGFDHAPFDFRGQRWVVSGATGGIGRAIALGAARHGADVVALARDSAKLAALSAESPSAGTIRGEAADLASVAATRAVAGRISAGGPVDVLVNNVGLMLHAHSLSAEGIETSFATNLLSHFVLTEALRQSAALGPRSLVVSMSSGGMYGARLDLDLLEARSPASHDGLRAYAQHKRAQVELTRYWNRQGDGHPLACVMHPGWVDTDGVRSALPTFRRTLRRVLRSAEEGADTALWLAATRPAAPPVGGIWLDRQLEDEHAFGFTRGGASAAELVAWLRGRLDSAGLG